MHDRDTEQALKAKAFNLYQRNEKGHYVRFDLTEELKDWAEGKTLDFPVFYKKGNEYFPVRVCAYAFSGGKREVAILLRQAKVVGGSEYAGAKAYITAPIIIWPGSLK